MNRSASVLEKKNEGKRERQKENERKGAMGRENSTRAGELSDREVAGTPGRWPARPVPGPRAGSEGGVP